MALVNPVTVFPGYTLTGTEGAEIIGIPLSVLTGLTAAEANATTGDIREVITALVERTRTSIAALPANDRPTNFAITSQRVTSAANNDNQEITYTLRGTKSAPFALLNYPAEA